MVMLLLDPGSATETLLLSAAFIDSLGTFPSSKVTDPQRRRSLHEVPGMSCSRKTFLGTLASRVFHDLCDYCDPSWTIHVPVSFQLCSFRGLVNVCDVQAMGLEGVDPLPPKVRNRPKRYDPGFRGQNISINRKPRRA